MLQLDYLTAHFGLQLEGAGQGYDSSREELLVITADMLSG